MARTRIKICGLTREADVDEAIEAGADALGFVLYPKSPRAVTLARAAELISRVPPFVTPVLLTVNASPQELRAATEEVPYDSSGRILFPPMMRRKGQIGDLALFLGTGETFQIWNPDLLLKDPRIPEDLKDIARFRLEERGQS